MTQQNEYKNVPDLLYATIHGATMDEIFNPPADEPITAPLPESTPAQPRPPPVPTPPPSPAPNCWYQLHIFQPTCSGELARTIRAKMDS